MEGLIKGLIDVALDAVAGNNDDDNRRHHNAPEDNDDELGADPRDERSRSTWAQVVSSGKQDGDGSSSSSWPTTNVGSHGRRSSGDWETVGNSNSNKKHHYPERPQLVSVDCRHAYKRPPSEQDYNDEVDYGVDIEPAQEELHDLSKACSKLWDLDSNRLVPGKDYEIDCGEGKKAYQKGDMASGSLFSWLRDDVFRRPTYSRFLSLLDNYNPDEGSKENVTPQEKHEQAAFIEEISRTAPIKYLYKYLISKGIAYEHYEAFKRMLTGLWFDFYGRGGTFASSSAFEHIFVGEIKGRGEHEVSGFHNWIQFYIEEVKGRIDYQGYIFPRRRGQIPDSETQLLTIQFEWRGILKSVSSTLVGVSPEFEVALYTLCFYFGREDNHVYLGPYSVNIKCYHLGTDKIGSIFPIAE